MTNEDLIQIKEFAYRLNELIARVAKGMRNRDKLIHMLYSEGVSVMEIARLFDMKHPNVSAIIRRIND